MKKNFSESSGVQWIAVTCNTMICLLLSSGVAGCILYLLLALSSMVMEQQAVAQSAPLRS